MARLPHVQTNSDCFLNGANRLGLRLKHFSGILENGPGEGTDCQQDILGYVHVCTYILVAKDISIFGYNKSIMLYDLY